MSVELCRQGITELLESMAGLGFKSCIAFGGHGPTGSLLMDIHKELGGHVGGMRFWAGNKGSVMQDVWDNLYLMRSGLCSELTLRFDMRKKERDYPLAL